MFKRLKLWQRGQVLVFTALLLPVMLVILVCALNAGILYFEYTRLQNAADAAALAGAESYAQRYKIDENSTKAAAYAQGVVNESVVTNLRGSGEITESPIELQNGKVSTETDSGFDIELLWGFIPMPVAYEETTTKSDYAVKSTVKLSKNVSLLFADKFGLDPKITATSSAEQSLSKTEKVKRGSVLGTPLGSSTEFSSDIKDSKLTR